jgi:hypothetical protein
MWNKCRTSDAHLAASSWFEPPGRADGNRQLRQLCRVRRLERTEVNGMLSSPIFALAALLADPSAAAAPDGPEIVVRAVRGKCRIQLDERNLSDREFSARAGEWASLGTPVRVISPRGADYKCLARIAFKLNEKGVRLIHFVDRVPEPPDE